jgi:hypothetical protein
VINLFIPIALVSITAQELLTNNKITSLLIDYATNNVVGFHDNEEVEVFSFKDYLIMDNRFNKYTITYDATGLYLNVIRTALNT